MKKNLLKTVIAIALLFVSVSCSAQRLFKDVPSSDNIQKVYINSAMMKLAGAAASTNAFGDDPIIKEAVKSVDNLEIISCSSSGEIKKIKPICDKAVESSGMELATEVEDGKQTVKIYTAPDADNDNITNALVMLVSEPNEYVAICIRGKIDIAKLTQAIAAGDSNKD